MDCSTVLVEAAVTVREIHECVGVDSDFLARLPLTYHPLPDIS